MRAFAEIDLDFFRVLKLSLVLQISDGTWSQGNDATCPFTDYICRVLLIEEERGKWRKQTNLINLCGHIPSSTNPSRPTSSIHLAPHIISCSQVSERFVSWPQVPNTQEKTRCHFSQTASTAQQANERKKGASPKLRKADWCIKYRTARWIIDRWKVGVFWGLLILAEVMNFITIKERMFHVSGRKTGRRRD